MAKTYPVRGFWIHHSASDGPSTTERDIDRWHKDRGWKGTGYNYVIEWDGKIVPARPEGTVTCGAKGYNHGYIHICVVGNTMDIPWSHEQIEALELLLDHLIDKYDLTRDHVVGHRQFAATLCPGDAGYEWLEAWRKGKNTCG